MREMVRAVVNHCQFVREDGSTKGKALERVARFFLVLALRRQTGLYPSLLNITAATGMPDGFAEQVDRGRVAAAINSAFAGELGAQWEAQGGQRRSAEQASA